MTAGCTQAAFLAVNLPAHFDDMDVVENLAYGPDSLQKLDLYIPAGAKEQLLDVIVFFYGGRWTDGSKRDFRFVGGTFTEKNYIVVVPDHRKFPQVRFPAFVEDGAQALAWVYRNISAYYGNPQRIHVVGHSSGAHIGALLTADAHYLAEQGADRSQVVHDFTGLAGPYAFIPDEPDLENIFGPPSNYLNMQVTTFIDGQQPPMLLLYGDSDTTVRYSNLAKLEEQIHAKGGHVQSIIYHDVGHIGLAAALSWYNPHDASVAGDMVTFFTYGTGAAAAPAGP